MITDVFVDSLPCEVLEQILEDDRLELNDVIHFALTSKQAYWTVTTSNKLWRTKFFQRWPFLQAVYDELLPDGTQNINWHEETKERIMCRRRLMLKLSQMSAKHYEKYDLTAGDLREYDELFMTEHGARPISYHYLMDELVSLIEQPLIECNLTHKYYAHKVARYLKQTYLAKEWEKFVALPAERQTTEKGAILVAQWSQPEKRVSGQKVSEMLDDIAQQTRDLLVEKYPDIPINAVPKSELDRWKLENLYDNQWSNKDSRIIVSVLCEIMFNRLGYHGNSEMYYSSINSFIDQVLIHKRGIPITLAIVFESVARRLGLHCETISFPVHFLLRWKERYIPRTKEDELVESYYIDVFNGGQFLTRNSCSAIAGATRCPIEKYNIHQATSAVKVVQRMANNLEVAGRQRTQMNGRAARLRSALELLHMVKPRDSNTMLHLARFYMLYQMDVTDLIRALNEMLNAEVEEESMGQAKHIIRMLEHYKNQLETTGTSQTPKKRNSYIKYAVGMIMTDKRQKHVVITGWGLDGHPSIEPIQESEIVINDSGVNNQPEHLYYQVFVEDGSTRYVVQKTLFISASPTQVDHEEIGKYFCKFMGSYYLPNEELAKQYPEDNEFLKKMQHLNIP